MDTLSASISTSFTLPKSNLNNHHHLLHPHPSAAIPKTTKLSNKTTTFTTQSHLFPQHINNSSRPPSPLKHSPKAAPEYSHCRPSTGYAVALLDAARRHGTAEAVRRDARRLSRWLRDDHLRRAVADPSMGVAAKGEMMVELVKRGGLNKHLVKLVKVLAEKCKVDMLGQVMSEFGKMYDVLSSFTTPNEQVVVLPFGVEMEEHQILEIVGRIQRVTGAHKVTVRKAVEYPRFV